MIISYSVIGPGEGDRHLERFFKRIFPLVDKVTVCLNNADDKTRAIAERYAAVIIEDDREWGKNQWRIKQDYLKQISWLNPDWILTMDCDEFLDTRITRKVLDELSLSKTDVSYKFWCIQLWNDESHWREDMSFENVRFYKFVPEYGLNFESQPLHCGLAPVYAYKYATSTNLTFLHYGLMLFEDRKRKVARYAQYDPEEKYIGKTWYQGLRNEVKGEPLVQEELWKRLPEIIHKKKLPTMKNTEKKIYLFRNPHGKIIPAVGEKIRDQYLKTDGFSLVQEVMNVPRFEAPVIKAEVKVEKKKGGRPKKNAENKPSEQKQSE